MTTLVWIAAYGGAYAGATPMYRSSDPSATPIQIVGYGVPPPGGVPSGVTPIWVSTPQAPGAIAANVYAVGAISSSAPVYPPYPAGAAALYSLRQTSAAYVGKCLNVRRSSDNATQDIGFNSSGNVDMAAAATFAAGSPLFVAKWYDQSGNGLDIANATAANQPQFNIINGKPWLAFFSQVSTTGLSLATATVPTLTGNQTIGFAGQSDSDFVMMPASQFDNTNGWFLTFNGGGSSNSVGDHPGVFQYFTTNGAGTVRDTGRYYARTNRYVAKRSSGVATLYVNGAQTATGAAANNAASTAKLVLGANSDGSYPFSGLIGEFYIYASALIDADRLAIDASQAAYFTDTGFSTPYSGTSALEFSLSQAVVCGNVLAYERTASWTAFVAAQLYAYPASAFGSVFYTNVPDSGGANTFPGHEIWMDGNGHIRVRVISNIGAGNFVGVIGTTNLVDGKKHTLAYSYDGSSSVAGVKVYIDGVLETTTTEANGLTASIIGAGQSLYVGNQQMAPSHFNVAGAISFFQIDNVVRSGSYIATNFTGGGQIPPADANTDIRLLLNDGSGTTAADASGHSRNGTLSSSTMWAP